MSDFIAGCVAVALAIQVAGYVALVGKSSVLSRRIRRLAEEIVSLRSALRAASGVGSASGKAGDSR